MKKQRATVRPAGQAMRWQVAVDRAERRYILNHQPVTNLDKVIEFELGDMCVVRRLVVNAIKVGEEVSIASPVGLRLANARPGDQFTIRRPDECLVVKVLSIMDSVAQAVA